MGVLVARTGAVPGRAPRPALAGSWQPAAPAIGANSLLPACAPRRTVPAAAAPALQPAGLAQDAVRHDGRLHGLLHVSPLAARCCAGVAAGFAAGWHTGLCCCTPDQRMRACLALNARRVAWRRRGRPCRLLCSRHLPSFAPAAQVHHAEAQAGPRGVSVAASLSSGTFGGRGPALSRAWLVDPPCGAVLIGLLAALHAHAPAMD